MFPSPLRGERPEVRGKMSAILGHHSTTFPSGARGER
jgi:hypothetical protein